MFQVLIEKITGRVIGPWGIQSTPSKTDTFGTGSKCPSLRDVRLIESQIKEVKRKAGTNSRSPF